MEMKSLFLGLFFSIGVFAVKSGVGLHFFFRSRGDSARAGAGKNIMVLFSFALAYLALFCCSGLVLENMDMMAWYNTAQIFLKSGMFVHVIMAAILVVWGLRSIMAGRREHGPGYGWMALVFPCPVCMTVIFFISAFLQSLFSCSGIVVAVSAWAVFMVTTFIAVPMAAAVPDNRLESDVMVGAAMLIVAAYFSLSVLIMPQFADISKIYGLAKYRGTAALPDTSQLLGCVLFVVLLFAAGAGLKRTKMVQTEGET